MKFVADRDIPFVQDAFSTIGSVRLFPATAIEPSLLKDADGLIVRSITRINRDLLQGSSVRFVGTATIGTDHVDLPWLERHAIGFASAPGCNAKAVGEYVLQALVHFSTQHRLTLESLSMGIIGAGHTGSAVAEVAGRLGLDCRLNDPPLAAATGDPAYRSLTEVIGTCRILSLHVPLTRLGRFPTHHLFDAAILKTLHPETILINTCRGGVLDETAWRQLGRPIRGLLLDVWENEPAIHPATLSMADLATPHVAGYSFEGKVRAVSMVYRAACRFFGCRETWDERSVMQSHRRKIGLTSGNEPLSDILRQVYDIGEDDRRLRRLPFQANPQAYFAGLRNRYRFRPEFRSVTLVHDNRLSADRRRLLKSLGFRLTESLRA